MSEQIRQQHLNNLGVTVWTSTVTLENALATPEAMLVEHVATPSEPARPATAKEQTTSKDGSTEVAVTPSNDTREKLRDQFANLGLQAKPSKEPHNSDKEPARTTETSKQAIVNSVNEAVPKFRLRMMAVSDELLIVDDISDSAPGFTRFHRLIISQLLSSLNLPMHPSYDVQEVHWPLVPGAKIDQSPAEALKAILMKLRLLASKHKTSSILLCGEQSSKWARDTKYQDLDIGTGFEDEHGLKFVTSHGLDHLMQTPSAKKQLWLHVRHLRS